MRSAALLLLSRRPIHARGRCFDIAFAADVVIVEITEQLRGPALLHDALEPPPGRLGSLRGPPPLRIDVPHDVIDVDVIAARCGLLRIFFLEFVRFRFLAHATEALDSSRSTVLTRAFINGNAPSTQYHPEPLNVSYFTRSFN